MYPNVLIQNVVFWFASKAEAMLHRHERSVRTDDVLKLIEETRHSSYDCEFVALAQAHGVPLVTLDKRLTKLFPATATYLSAFVSV